MKPLNSSLLFSLHVDVDACFEHLIFEMKYYLTLILICHNVVRININNKKNENNLIILTQSCSRPSACPCSKHIATCGQGAVSLVNGRRT